VKRLAVAVACLLATSAGAWAQEPFNVAVPVTNLATLFTGLYGPSGLIVDSLATLPGEQPHTAHFTSAFQADFTQFNTALVGQLVTLPRPSPASGFTFHFDPTLGVFERSTESFGPILAERADTIGAGRLSFGFAFQRFSFDSIEGLDMGRIPAVFTHDDAALRGGREDVVTTVNAIDAQVSQFTTFVTVGVTDWFDIALAVPVVSTSITVVSDATIKRIGTVNELTHFFRQATGEVGNRRLFTAEGSASGLGDLVIRAKATVSRRAHSGIGVGVDVRLPTGREMDLLGTGGAGVQPFAVWSGTFGRISPHVNAGYQWNGSSVLAGDPAAGVAEDLPDQVTWVAGADVHVNRRLTVAFDVLGRYMIDTRRLARQDFHALDGKTVFPNIGFTTDSFSAWSGAAGLKFNPFGQVLVDVNLLFKLDERGLRDKVTPLIGVEYAF